MTPKEYKKKKVELGNILNTFDVEKITEYMKKQIYLKHLSKITFLNLTKNAE